MRDLVSLLNAESHRLDALERLRRLRETVQGRIVFTTSFGLEDQYLSHLVFSQDIPIDVVTLDTGRKDEM
ncbi:MAG TPA: phosphoadenosine phosphosulfate reductase, partial [Rhodoblastus sp.]|nr:phosphoadenosine phosphosulfate reductase [Rhodoblastus sp.]